MTTRTPEGSIGEVVSAFLKLGFTAFGGPAAHIAMMRDEFVTRRSWLTDVEFVELVGLTNLIPGPNSTELAIHLGYRRAGKWGLVVAGLCFIVPAMLIVMALAWAYVRFGSQPEAQAMLYGMKPVVVAVVLQALVRLVSSVMITWIAWGIGIGAGALAFLGVPEVAIVFVPGLALGLFSPRQGARSANIRNLIAPILAVVALVGLSIWVGTRHLSGIPYGPWPLFGVFLKVGTVLYGSGYVLLSYLNTDLVAGLGWLSKGQLLDAVSVGQFTPGPVFTTATFVGYLLGGVSGALIATLAIFLPSFVFVAISARWLERARQSDAISAFLRGVNAASLGLMAAVLLKLGKEAMVDGWTIALAIVAIVLLLKTKWNSAWLVGEGRWPGWRTRSGVRSRSYYLEGGFDV